METNLLGVRINYPFNKKDIDSILEATLKSNNSKFIFTVNPEFIVDASKDSHFKNILNKGYFNSADGIGVVMALEYQSELLRTNDKWKSIFAVVKKHLKGKLVSKRFTGVEITERILEFANKNFLTIFLLGGDSKKMVSEKLLVDLEKRYPHARFIGASSSFISKPNDDEVTINFINKCMKKEGIKKLDFLLVGYGHPYQEKWIDRNSNKLKVGTYVGVGGTFDFLSGNIKRAPKVIQKLGLEWLFRLVMQPKRVNRIYKATVTFSYLIFNKIKR